MHRSEVYALIDGEREYQDSLWPQDGAPGFPNPLTEGEFVLMIQAYVAEAAKVWLQEKKPCGQTLAVVRKIAAIAVNCMEQHGAPPRTK